MIESPYQLYLAICVLAALTVMWRRRTRDLALARRANRLKSHLDWNSPRPRRRLR